MAWVMVAWKTGVNFLHILCLQRRKRGEREAQVAPEGKSGKNNACAHTIVEVVPPFKYERNYPVGYFPYMQ